MTTGRVSQRKVASRMVGGHAADQSSPMGSHPDGEAAKQRSDFNYSGVRLEGLPVAWIDNLLPRRPRNFLCVVVGVVCTLWLIGWSIASDRTAFLLSKEWQIQPLFLAGHLVTLRFFVTCYSHNYLKGVHYLDLSPSDAKRWTLRLLGPLGGLVALILASPFCFYDIISLGEYCLVPEQGIREVDVLLCIVWCVEWIANAYLWTILVGFACLSSWTIRHHTFRAPTLTVIQLKQYRPFLLMSVQGSTILVFFGALCGAYVWYADGDLSDFIGLGITLLLLMVCFVPPWLLLRNRLEGELRQQYEALSHSLVRLQTEERDDSEDLTAVTATRLDEAIAMLRITHLDRLQQELGRAEGRAVVMRLLIPLGTVLMKVVRPLLIGV